jgi:hypothetical protein
VTKPTNAADLAADLGMLQPDDVEVYVSEILGLDLHYDEMPPEIATDVRTAFNPHGERTAAARLYWPGHDEDPKPATPTAGEGFYADE